jgi:hypothetical protein
MLAHPGRFLFLWSAVARHRLSKTNLHLSLHTDEVRPPWNSLPRRLSLPTSTHNNHLILRRTTQPNPPETSVEQGTTCLLLTTPHSAAPLSLRTACNFRLSSEDFSQLVP